jgi:ABC-type dipeptide/oligopeptide/nickel transport system permease subunit
MLLVLAFFLVGNGLRDALDNKSEASQLVGA